MSISTPKQIPFRFQLDSDASFANFFVAAKNAAAVYALKNQLEPAGEEVIYLWGAEGVGRSHLLQAAAHYAIEHDASAIYIPLSDVLSFAAADILENLELQNIICLDELDSIGGNPDWEQALFHFYNRVRDSGHRLLLAAAVPPNEIKVQLADLKSRLTWGVTFHLHPLSDEEKVQALQLRGAERGIEVTSEVANYILHRSARGINDLFKRLEELDDASLAEQRKLTIPFVKQTFGW